MATSVLRRYTPPTCTLEIAAAGSALSRWTERTVLKNLRFRLSFDDPKLPPEQQVTVRGDRTQLEALSEVVSTYVQNFLNQTDLELPWLADSLHADSASPLPTRQLDVALDSAEPHALAPIAPASSALVELPQNGRLDPHTLENDGAAVVPPPAEPIAPLTQPDTLGISLQPKGLLSHHLRLGSLAADNAQTIVPLSATQLFDLANALEDYNADALALPELVRSPWWQSAGWAKIAAVGLLSLGATGAIAKFVLDVSNPVTQTIAVDPQSGSTAPPTPSIFRSPGGLPTAPGGAPLNLEPVPMPAPSGVTEAPPLPAPSPEPAVPSSSAAAPLQTVPIDPAVPTNPAPATSQAPIIVVPQQPSLPADTAPAPTSEDSIALAPAERSLAAGSASSLSAAPGATSRTAALPESGTAFDTIPQVAEVRSYFQQNWTPPEGLTQTLEYRIVLNGDGTINRIVPLGQTAATYIDRTNMPLMNESFVSPVADGSNPQIRLVLGSDGSVQTFLEGNAAKN